MRYLAILGRQPEISLAELGALFSDVKKISKNLATFAADSVNINRLGGTIKVAALLEKKPIDFLRELPDGKITLGVSDYSKNASFRSAKTEALKLKQILVRHGRSVRVVENKDAVLSTATSLHNGLSGKNDRKCELIKVEKDWYKVVGVQDIDAYTKRDQARPARDARVGMLPPKLAQILINLCGPLPEGSRILDPFCGTGVVLQEALLMGYTPYGTDLSERMVEYTEKNLNWLSQDGLKQSPRERCDQRGACAASPVTTGASVARSRGNSFQAVTSSKSQFQVSQGDATSYKWTEKIDAVACEGYLGKPMSQIPADIKLKTEKQECKAIVLGFLKNLSSQIASGTPVVIACPAWLRPDGTYARLGLFGEDQPSSSEKVDYIEDMGYNVKDISREGLLYHRDDQIVARDIIILRKK